jgi:uncharacterized protein (DUF1330 family)
MSFTSDGVHDTVPRKENADVVRTSVSLRLMAKIFEKNMPAYAVAHLRDVTMGPPIIEYLQRIDSTLEAFAGRFLVHGAEVEVLEGSWPGHLIISEFPDRERARAWYESSAYQEILPLRTNNSEGDVIFVDGASEGHRATDVLAE